MRFLLMIVLSVLTAVLSGVPAPAQNVPIARAAPALANEASSARLSGDIALAKATISVLQGKDFKVVRERIDRWSVGEVSDDTLRRLSDIIGTSEPTCVETISATETHDVQTGDGSSRILLEYGFGSKWVIADAVVKTVGAEKSFARLYLTVNSLPLRELNAFHLLGKGPLQYLFLAGWILVIVLTGWAIYFAFRWHTGWRRWVLIALMPLGLTPTVAVNWNSAQAFILEAFSNPAGYNIPIFAIRYPMTFFGNTETGAPYLYISAPLVAVAYLIWQWARRRSAGLKRNEAAAA